MGGGARRQSGSERLFCFFFQAEDGIRDLVRSRGLGDVYKRQPWETAKPYVIAAIQNGITPTINSMMVVGVVSLPGMMTGQILAGADPHQAVLYQIITLFLIATSSTLGLSLIHI